MTVKNRLTSERLAPSATRHESTFYVDAIIYCLKVDSDCPHAGDASIDFDFPQKLGMIGEEMIADWQLLKAMPSRFENFGIVDFHS